MKKRFSRCGLTSRLMLPGYKPARALDDGLLIDIGAEELDLEIMLQLIHILPYDHGNGVNLFAGGASGYPYPQFVIFGLPGEHLRQDFLSENIKCFGVPEKVRHAD